MTTVEQATILITSREWDVLCAFLLDGASNRVIGSRIFVTEDTVKTHMRHILRKAGCDNRAELAVRLARRDICIEKENDDRSS